MSPSTPARASLPKIHDPVDIDKILDRAFTQERVRARYFQYKRSKWDRFSDISAPKIDIPLGADGIAFETFEKQLDRHTWNISQRILEGRYIFYPFREVEILKDEREERRRI